MKEHTWYGEFILGAQVTLPENATDQEIREEIALKIENIIKQYYCPDPKIYSDCIENLEMED